jgi:hypothetical protein
MKNAPSEARLFELLARSGAWLVTLSLPSGRNPLQSTAKVARLCRDNGIRLAVDFLCGFPGQTRDSIRRALDSLRRIRPDTVGVNSVIRLYEGMGLARRIMASPGQRRRMIGSLEGNPGFLRPVFYRSLAPEELQEMIGGDPLFKVEGFERSSNYERLRRGGGQ